MEYIKCSDFFCIQGDTSRLIGLQVPLEGFELLLQVADIIGYNDLVTLVVAENLPMDYDTSIFPSKTRERILNIVEPIRIVTLNYEGDDDEDTVRTSIIRFREINGMESRISCKKYTGTITCICSSPDGERIAFGTNRGYVEEFDILSGEKIRSIDICERDIRERFDQYPVHLKKYVIQ